MRAFIRSIPLRFPIRLGPLSLGGKRKGGKRSAPQTPGGLLPRKTGWWTHEDSVPYRSQCRGLGRCCLCPTREVLHFRLRDGRRRPPARWRIRERPSARPTWIQRHTSLIAKAGTTELGPDAGAPFPTPPGTCAAICAWFRNRSVRIQPRTAVLRDL